MLLEDGRQNIDVIYIEIILQRCKWLNAEQILICLFHYCLIASSVAIKHPFSIYRPIPFSVGVLSDADYRSMSAMSVTNSLFSIASMSWVIEVMRHTDSCRCRISREVIEISSCLQRLFTEDTVYYRIDVFLPFIGVNVEIRIACQHCGQMCLCPVVEDMAGFSDLFSIGEFISYT